MNVDMNVNIQEKLRTYVRNYWDKSTGFYKNIVSDSEVDSIQYIGASILMTKFPELGGFQGGSFVQAIVNNDLEGAYGSADSTNQKVIFFYIQLITNFNQSLL